MQFAGHKPEQQGEAKFKSSSRHGCGQRIVVFIYLLAKLDANVGFEVTLITSRSVVELTPTSLPPIYIKCL